MAAAERFLLVLCSAPVLTDGAAAIQAATHHCHGMSHQYHYYFLEITDVTSCRVISKGIFTPASMKSRACWAGISPKGTAFLADSDRRLYGLYCLPSVPSWDAVLQGPGSTASAQVSLTFEWVTVLNLKEHVWNCQLSTTEAAGSPSLFYVYVSDGDEVFALEAEEGCAFPAVTSNPIVKAYPLRLPVCSDVVDYAGFVSLIEKDPSCSDSDNKVSWETLDEWRFRKIVETLEFSSRTLESESETSEVTKQTKKLLLEAEKLVFKLYLHALAESKLDLAMDVVKMLRLPGSLSLALKQAESRGYSVLAEHLNKEIESRHGTKIS